MFATFGGIRRLGFVFLDGREVFGRHLWLLVFFFFLDLIHFSISRSWLRTDRRVLETRTGPSLLSLCKRWTIFCSTLPAVAGLLHS